MDDGAVTGRAGDAGRGDEKGERCDTGVLAVAEAVER
jgi:hypothetical protein